MRLIDIVEGGIPQKRLPLVPWDRDDYVRSCQGQG